MTVFKEFNHQDFPTFLDQDLAIIRERVGWPVLTRHGYGLCITPGKEWSDTCCRLVAEHKPVGLNLSFAGEPEDLPRAMKDIGNPLAVRLGHSYDADVSELSDYADSLEIIEVFYPMKGQVHTPTFGKLRKLVLSCMAGAFSGIEDALALEEVLLYGGPKFRSLDLFRRLRKLRSLSLTKGGVQELGFTYNRPEMRELEILHCYKFASLDGLEAVPNLKRLEIVSAKKVPSIDAVAQLKELEWLTLDGCGTYKSLDPILELKNLHYLSLTGSTTFREADLKRLLDMPNLKVLIIESRRHYDTPLLYEVCKELRRRETAVHGTGWQDKLRRAWAG